MMKRVLLTMALLVAGMVSGIHGLAQTIIPLPNRKLFKLLADPTFPYIYGLVRYGDGPQGELIRFSTTTGAILDRLVVTNFQSDMAINPENDSIYILPGAPVGVQSVTVSKVDLDQFTVVAQRTIYGNYADGEGYGLHLAAGTRGRIYLNADSTCGGGILSYDFGRATNLAIYKDGIGVFGLGTSKDGSTLYRWGQLGCSPPFIYPTFDASITRYAIATNGNVTPQEHYSLGFGVGVDFPVFLDDAERWVFCANVMLDARNVTNRVNQFSENIYAISRDGTMAAGETNLFNTLTATVITNLSVRSKVQCFSGDQSKLFRFDPFRSALVMCDLNRLGLIGPVAAAVDPPDGSAVSVQVTQLSWSPTPLTSRYEVYFGLDPASVATANSDSTEHLGESTNTVISLPLPVTPRTTYYWRVDAEILGVIHRGSVWSFTVSPLVFEPAEIRISATNGFNPPGFPLGIGGSGAVSWSASVKGADWLSIDQTAGTAPSIVTASFKTAGLAPGFYTNQIELTANDLTIDIPVIVEVRPFPFRPSKVAADLTRHVIYGFCRPDNNGEQGYLFFLNTDTGLIENALLLGTKSADIAVNDAEDRIYVMNAADSEVGIIDLKSRSLLPSLHLGFVPLTLNPGGAGRIIVEYSEHHEFYTTITGVLVDTTNGSIAAQITTSSSGLGFSDVSNPSGAYYCYAEVGMEGLDYVDTLTRFDLTGGGSALAIRGGDYFTPGFLLISRDGNRLFWETQLIVDGELVSSIVAYDAKLKPLASFDEPIITCTSDGRIGFSTSSAYDVSTGRDFYGLPKPTNISVVDGQNKRFWYWTPSSFESIEVADIASPRVTRALPALSTLAAGGTVQLSATIDGLPPYSLQWQHEGTNLPAATNSILSLIDVQSVQTGRYQLIVSNDFGFTVSQQLLVVIASLPEIAAQPQNVSVPAGQTLNLSVGVTGSPPFICQWWLGDSVLPGITDTNLSIVNAQLENAGLYHVVVSNAVGSVTSSPAIVRIGSAAPSILEDPVSQTTLASFPIVFKVVATGSQPFHYQWLFDGTPLTGATTPQIQVVDSQAGNIGGYSAIVANAQGSITSAVARLDVTPQAPIFSTQPHGAVVSVGGGFSMVGTVVGTEPFAFQWIHNGTNLPGAIRNGLNIPDASFADAGTYTLLASNSVGTNWSEPAIISLVSSPQLVQKPASSIWETGATVTMSATASGIPEPTFEWSKEGTPGILGTSSTLTLTNVQATQTGYYTVQAVNPYGLDSTTFRMSVLGPQSRIVSWGDNSSGQTNVPPSMLPVVSIVGGDSHSVAVLRDGTIRAWGANDFGQTIVPSHSVPFVAVAAGAFHNLAVDANGALVAWGRNESGQTNIPVAATVDIVSVAAGEAYSMALRSDGQVIVWGYTSNGLGTLPRELVNLGTKVRAIAAGGAHCLALLDSGAVVGWGLNASGQTVSPRTAENVVAIAAGQSHSVALRSDGTVIAWGDNSLGQTTVPAGLSNVVAIAAGAYHTLALRSDGTVTGWGNDGYGQLDVPVGLNSVASISSGYYHAQALVPFTTIRARLTSVGYVLDWPGQGVLEAAPTLFGPWNPVGANGNSFTNLDMAQPARFFRLVQ